MLSVTRYHAVSVWRGFLFHFLLRIACVIFVAVPGPSI